MTSLMTTTYSGEEMTARAIAFVERYCSIVIAPHVFEDECDGGGKMLLLTHGPLMDTDVTVYDLYAEESVDSADFRVSLDGKIIAARGMYWEAGARRFRVRYWAGHDELPEDIEEVVEGVETMLENAEGSAGLKSEAYGSDYEYVLATLQEQQASPLFTQLNLLRRL